MNKATFYIIIAIATFVIGYLILGNYQQVQVSEQERQQLSKEFGDKFAQMRTSQQNKAQTSPHSSSTQETKQVEESPNVQAIIGVIYKKEGSTWFIKAKDSQKRINQMATKFEEYFLTNLKFDEDQKPLFDHLPEDSKIASTSSMRYATFMIDGVEVSIINLPGKQDIFSNVKRWMGQVGLNDQSPISMNFSKDKQTIFVKMPK